MPTRKLRAWAAEEAGIPDWLFDECYDAVGDLAETIALLLPPPDAIERPAAALTGSRSACCRCATPDEDAPAGRACSRAWRELDQPQRFVWNKLITGELPRRRLAAAGDARPRRRSAASTPAVDRAPADGRLGADARVLRAACSRRTPATPTSAGPTRSSSPIRSKARPTTLGDIADWQAEWKWDGIRAQLIRRGGQTFLWSRGEELVTDRFPELDARSATLLPDGTVIDGEILPWKDGARRCRSRSCSGASAARRSARRSWPRCRSCSSPTTCSRTTGDDVRERPLA